jgi:hypothetical protein
MKTLIVTDAQFYRIQAFLMKDQPRPVNNPRGNFSAQGHSYFLKPNPFKKGSYKLMFQKLKDKKPLDINKSNAIV